MIIAVDFDGTLCKHSFPEIGEPNYRVIKYVKDAQRDGCKLILWTCREGECLKDAVEWCEFHGILFDAVNENVPELKGRDFALRKVCADVYLDDRAKHINDIGKEVKK